MFSKFFVDISQGLGKTWNSNPTFVLALVLIHVHVMNLGSRQEG